MKVAAILLSSVTATTEFLKRQVRQAENASQDATSKVFSNDPDYPAEGTAFLEENFIIPNSNQTVRSGRGDAASGARKIANRKRLINSQIITPEKSAWYYHYHDYGCYCVAPTDPLKNRGKPVDEIDSACKRHALCYECAFSDFSNNKQECNPKNNGYKYKINALGSDKYAIACLNPENSCAYAACMCDKALAEELGQMVMRGILADKEYRDYDSDNCSGARQRELGIGGGSNGNGGMGGGMSPLPSGVMMAAAGESLFEGPSFLGPSGEERLDSATAKQCCGTYPNRHPYKPGHNHECCDVGLSTEELKPVGTC